MTTLITNITTMPWLTLIKSPWCRVRAPALKFKGQWFDPLRWQLEKVVYISGWKFMATQKNHKYFVQMAKQLERMSGCNALVRQTTFGSHLRPMWKTYFHKAQKQIVTELHSLSANSIKTYYGWMAKPQNYRVGAEAQEWIISVRKKVHLMTLIETRRKCSYSCTLSGFNMVAQW